MIFKTKEIEVNISSKAIDIGDIGAKFYTEDEETGAIRFIIKGTFYYQNTLFKAYSGVW